jgi:hypothetical protein
MKKNALLLSCLLTGFLAFGQNKEKKAPPPPPPPKVEAPAVPPPPPPPSVVLPEDYKEFLKRNPSVSGLHWYQNKTVTVRLKTGAKEVYDLSKNEAINQFEAKYGEMPAVPPPPPPAKKPKAPKASSNSK